jgi:prepilin-type N-terminal cleavage/methylation domain-containing protein
MLHAFGLDDSEETVRGKHSGGFTLVELMITMVVFVLVIAGAAGIFAGLFTQFKQQSKITESNIEGVVGLDTLRRDIEHAGYGLPWSFQNTISYSEAIRTPGSNYNDSPKNPPRALVSGNNVGVNGSDYLVIKAINVARNQTCERWTVMQTPPFTPTYNPRVWIPESENLVNSDRVIVISPGGTGMVRTLVMDGSTFFTMFRNITSYPWSPSEAEGTRIVYGVDPDTDLQMPFNRADYFISSSNVPQRCAQHTGVLEKAVVNQGGGGLSFLPLLDCVADMQVIYLLDMDGNGRPGTASNADGTSVATCCQDQPSESSYAGAVPATLNDAGDLRNRVKEVRVYILTHEGQKDINYTYASRTITVGEFGLGNNFDLETIIGTDRQHYRWKLYTLVVRPDNLR